MLLQREMILQLFTSFLVQIFSYQLASPSLVSIDDRRRLLVWSDISNDRSIMEITGSTKLILTGAREHATF